MKITVESTTRIVTLNGIETRVWEGTTERGVKIEALIPRVAVCRDEDCSQFEAELQERHRPASETTAFPLRMVI